VALEQRRGAVRCRARGLCGIIHEGVAQAESDADWYGLAARRAKGGLKACRHRQW